MAWKKERGGLADQPLDQTPVVYQVSEGDEEYDGRDDEDEEPAQGEDAGVGEEHGAVAGLAEEGLGLGAEEVEDVVLR